MLIPRQMVTATNPESIGHLPDGNYIFAKCFAREICGKKQAEVFRDCLDLAFRFPITPTFWREYTLPVPYRRMVLSPKQYQTKKPCPIAGFQTMVKGTCYRNNVALRKAWTGPFQLTFEMPNVANIDESAKRKGMEDSRSRTETYSIPYQLPSRGLGRWILLFQQIVKEKANGNLFNGAFSGTIIL